MAVAADLLPECTEASEDRVGNSGERPAAAIRAAAVAHLQLECTEASEDGAGGDGSRQGGKEGDQDPFF